MALYEGSRYATADLASVADNLGDYHVTVFRYLPGIPAFTTYIVIQQGARLDLLADRFLGDPGLWWQIADANPELPYPDALEPGTMVRIPSAATG